MAFPPFRSGRSGGGKGASGGCCSVNYAARSGACGTPRLRSVYHTPRHPSPIPPTSAPFPRPPPLSFAALSRPWRAKALRKPSAFVLRWLQAVPKCGTIPHNLTPRAALRHRAPSAPLGGKGYAPPSGERLSLRSHFFVFATLTRRRNVRLRCSRSGLSLRYAALSRLHSFAPPSSEIAETSRL